MTKRGKLKIILDSGVTIWLSLFLLVFICCKNPTSPESEKTEINITVTNECGVAVDIYMDNNLQFSVEYQESRTIQNVSLGDHEFLAKKKGTQTVLSSLSVELTEITDFLWTLQSEASMHVTNEYGESLNIYGDGNLLSEISSPATLVIENVLYGNRLFEAKKVSDGTIVASLNTDIAENKAYFWTIKK